MGTRGSSRGCEPGLPRSRAKNPGGTLFAPGVPAVVAYGYEGADSLHVLDGPRRKDRSGVIATAPKVEHPTEDKRWKIVDAAMRRNGHQRHGLIEALHAVQESFGYLDESALRYVAASLRAPLSEVYGVATFYHYFTLEPPGKHTCVVCLGTACYIKGALALTEEVTRRFHVATGETSADGELSLLEARCIGSCGLAPVVVLDGKAIGKIGADELGEEIERAIRGER